MTDDSPDPLARQFVDSVGRAPATIALDRGAAARAKADLDRANAEALARCDTYRASLSKICEKGDALVIVRPAAFTVATGLDS